VQVKIAQKKGEHGEGVQPGTVGQRLKETREHYADWMFFSRTNEVEERKKNPLEKTIKCGKGREVKTLEMGKYPTQCGQERSTIRMKRKNGGRGEKGRRFIKGTGGQTEERNPSNKWGGIGSPSSTLVAAIC